MTINKERFDRVLAWLDAGGDDQYSFDMNYWYRKPEGCNTVCCIGGYIAIVEMGVPDTCEDFPNYSNEVMGNFLGISTEDAEKLFYMVNREYELQEVTPPIAASVIRHLLETGVVDWNHGFNEETV